MNAKLQPLEENEPSVMQPNMVKCNPTKTILNALDHPSHLRSCHLPYRVHHRVETHLPLLLLPTSLNTLATYRRL